MIGSRVYFERIIGLRSKQLLALEWANVYVELLENLRYILSDGEVISFLKCARAYISFVSGE